MAKASATKTAGGIVRPMRAITVKKLGQFEDVLEFVEDFPCPEIKKDTEVLVRVQACSLSPGDSRRIRGDISAVWNPKPPFIPGMDICGTVERGGAAATFKVGDCVFASDGSFLGGMAEYAVIDSSTAHLKPEGISPAEASTLANSALRAKMTFEKAQIKGHERVLVIGASGGFGLFLVQFLKNAEVAYLAAISTQETLLKELGVDEVVDYNKEDWWSKKEWKSEPFDIIFDCVGGLQNWPRAKNSKVVKNRRDGGLYFAVSMHKPVMITKNAFTFAGLMAEMVGIMVWSKMSWWAPRYMQLLIDGKSSTEQLQDLVELVEEKKLKVILDPPQTFPFTKDGAVQALHLMESRHAHGKIVISISDSPQGD